MAADSTYEIVKTHTTSSLTASYTLSSIPQTYTDLFLVLNVVPNGSSSGNYTVNGDTTSGLYSSTAVVGLPSSGSGISFRLTNSNYLDWYSSGGSFTNSSNLHLDTFHFMNYSNTNVFKTILHRENPGQAAYTGGWVSLWRNTAAITSITFNYTANFGIGTTFNLYGIKAA